MPLEDGGTMPYDFVYGDKLTSYKLAFWTFRTIERAVETLVNGAHERVQAMITSTATNFASYRLRYRVCPPEELRAFDEEHGLALTSTT